MERWLGPGLGALALLVGLWNSWSVYTVQTEVQAQAAVASAAREASAATAVAAGIGGPRSPMGPGGRNGAPARGGPQGKPMNGEPVADRMQTEGESFAKAEGLDEATTQKLLDALEQRVASFQLLRDDVKSKKVDPQGARAEIEELRTQSDATLTGILGADGFARFESALKSSAPPGLDRATGRGHQGKAPLAP